VNRVDNGIFPNGKVDQKQSLIGNQYQSSFFNHTGILDKGGWNIDSGMAYGKINAL